MGQRARHDELVNLDEDDWTVELIEEAEAIEARLGAIEEAVEERAAFRAQDFSIAGCIATVGYDGKLKVIEGLVRPEDMPERADAGNDDGTDPGRVDGPVITEPLTTHTDPRARAREETWIGIGLAERAMRAHPWEWADPFGWPNLVSKAQAHAMAPRALVELAVPCRDPQPDG